MVLSCVRHEASVALFPDIEAIFSPSISWRSRARKVCALVFLIWSET
jgi:hypothetical protein